MVRDAAGLRNALLAADAIFVPDTKASTAGIHVAKVLAQLGIAGDVAARLRVFPNGATAMRELAASDARRPIGCTQSTEIISTGGVMPSGSLPPGCELATMYTAVSRTGGTCAGGPSLIGLLTGPGSKGSANAQVIDHDRPPPAWDKTSKTTPCTLEARRAEAARPGVQGR